MCLTTKERYVVLMSVQTSLTWQQHIKCLHALQETIEWLARPENYDPDRTPPGLEGFDPVPFLLSSLPITASVMATQVAHELGHRVVAFQRKARPQPALKQLLIHPK